MEAQLAAADVVELGHLRQREAVVPFAVELERRLRERKKAEKGRRKRTFGEWLKMLRAVWKARKAKQAKAKAAGG